MVEEDSIIVFILLFSSLILQSRVMNDSDIRRHSTDGNLDGFVAAYLRRNVEGDRSSTLDLKGE